LEKQVVAKEMEEHKRQKGESAKGQLPLKIGDNDFILHLKLPSLFFRKYIDSEEPKVQTEEEIELSEDIFKSMVALNFGNWQEQSIRHICGLAGPVSRKGSRGSSMDRNSSRFSGELKEMKDVDLKDVKKDN
jgi:hypothetical protein